jgi:hypothetical protein
MKQTTFKPCKTCEERGVTQDNSPACRKFKVPIEDIEKCGCTWHNTTGQKYQCDLCKQLYSSLIIYQTEDRELYLCENCYNNLNTCRTCRHATECGFTNDRSAPQYINQTTNNGFMRVQQQVKNPTLVERHCLSCRCSIDDKGTCCREIDAGVSCGHWMLL